MDTSLLNPLLSSDTAFSFEFEEFYIPEGSELYVYSPKYEMVQGAYTHLIIDYIRILLRLL